MAKKDKQSAKNMKKQQKKDRKKALKERKKVEKKARKALEKAEKESVRRQAVYVKSCEGLNHRLVTAASSGWTPHVEQCINKGALVNELGPGTTALNAAARFGHLEVMQVLFAAGADPDVLSADEEGGVTALWSAVAANETAAVQLLLQAAADPDIPTKLLGETPLCLASRMGRLEIMQQLLDAGADPDIRNIYGWSALHAAIREAQSDAVQMLLSHGCGDVQDLHGEFALDLAIRLGRENEIGVLRKVGAVCPASDPTSLMDKMVRLENHKPKSQGKKPRRRKGPSTETGRVLDCKQDWRGTRFEVQFDCPEEDMPRKWDRGLCWCCNSSPPEDAESHLKYDFDRCEKMVHLKHYCYVGGQSFAVIDRLHRPSEPVEIPLIMQPRPAESVGRGYSGDMYRTLMKMQEHVQ